MRAAAVFVLAFVCVSAAQANAQGSVVPAAPAAEDASSDASTHWFDPIAGKKLISVDGSTITVSTSESGLALEIVSPGGSARDLNFSFAGDGIGTISDGGPKAVGIFRQTDSGLSAEFADGHSELFAVNSAGGISMVLSGAAANSYCMRWYPDGHTFDAADRKAALAAYASKLGLAEPAVQKTQPGSNCSDAGFKSRRSAPQKRDALAGTTTYEDVVPAQPILVRTSEVHLIDADPTPPPVVQQTQPIAAPQQAVQPPRPAQLLASAAPDKSVLPIRGASACLSIDSDGDNWGFRNACSYAVQFAYCLKNGTDKTTACGSGAGSGNVAANGFASVLASNSIVTADQEFRWIACAGVAGHVAARLDRPDPPAGRCIAQSAS